jgi:hypothetical protein
MIISISPIFKSDFEIKNEAMQIKDLSIVSAYNNDTKLALLVDVVAVVESDNQKIELFYDNCNIKIDINNDFWLALEDLSQEEQQYFIVKQYKFDIYNSFNQDKCTLTNLKVVELAYI